MTEGPGIDWTALTERAHTVFGIRDFRPGQRELLEAVLSGRDALGILPTGGGKSLVFQLASLFLPRPVVVVTPLISLAEDQTDKLEARLVAATRLDSSLCAAEAREVNAAIAGGKLELLFVTPERLQQRDFLALLQRHGCSLFVVDEAHCVSHWGHDFRPAYAQLSVAAAALGRPPILALTATATSAVERDISEVLGLTNTCRVRTCGERENLHFRVRRVEGDEQKLRVLERLLSTEAGSGLIYCTTIKVAERVFEHLVAQNHPVGLYHGELHPAVRDATQDAFMDGRYRIVVATKAFGMGIDKPDTRFVIHYQLPDSIESYVQEAGRAGRDGEPARATLLFDPDDARVQRFFLRQKQPPGRAVTAVLDWLAADVSGRARSLSELEGRVSERWREVIVADVARLGFLRLSETSEVVTVAKHFERSAAERGAKSTYGNRRARDAERLERMLAYATSVECRTGLLLRHFEESLPGPCLRCDNCGERASRVARSRERGTVSKGPI